MGDLFLLYKLRGRVSQASSKEGISHTGHWQEPAGHWQEEPQLHPWSPVTVVSIEREKKKVKYDEGQPRYDPAISEIGPGQKRRGSSLICEVMYSMEDKSAYSFCMFGVGKTGEAFGSCVGCKGEVGEKRGGMGPGPYILVTFRDTLK